MSKSLSLYKEESLDAIQRANKHVGALSQSLIYDRLRNVTAISEKAVEVFYKYKFYDKTTGQASSLGTNSYTYSA